jgi:DNA-binding NtrC family response regulator
MYPPRLARRAVPASRQAQGFHGAVSEFKRQLIEVTLRQMGGNRTLAARVLGLQRTYLLRLIRELGVAAPPPQRRRRIVGAG